MFDRKMLGKEMLSSVSVDLDEDKITLSFSVPTDRGSVTYEDEIEWNNKTPSAEAKEAFHRFVDLLIQETVNDPEVKCGTCSGKCCHHYDTIRITKADVDRLEDAGYENFYTLWSDGSLGIEGSIGYLNTVPWRGYSKDKGDKACLFLLPSGRCGVYQIRPDVCRRFPAQNCDLYEEDPRKLSPDSTGAKKRKLRLMK